MKTDFTILDTLVRRLKLIGINITMEGNYPWIYLDTINGKKVTEKLFAKHGFTISFYPIREDQKMKLFDSSKLFQIIRKYK